jgi:hypothetical membrane protein
MVLLAMVQYPGGTSINAGTIGYTFDQNFLSDLGMTVAYNGRPNHPGSTLFLASLCAMVIGLGSALWHMIQRYLAMAASRSAARAAWAATIVVCLAFVGVAFTPEDRVMEWHVQFTLLTFRLAPLVPCMLAIAASRAGHNTRRAAIGWATLTVVMVAYLLLLMFGPATTTEHGLRAMVLAQKLTTVAGSGIVLRLRAGA